MSELREAIKKTGKAYRKDDIDSCVTRNEIGVLYWYGTIKNNEGAEVTLNEIFADNWHPYYDKKEIKPESAGELWRSPNAPKTLVLISRHKTELMVTTEIGTRYRLEEYQVAQMDNAISNRNGWTRLYPSVE